MDSFLLFCASKELMALISPMVPMDMRSSLSPLEREEYFFTICATRRKFRSIKTVFASSSPSRSVSYTHLDVYKRQPNIVS